MTPLRNNERNLGLSFDIAVHAGTLIAVIYYFRSELYLNEAVLKIPYLGGDIYFWELIH